MLFTAHIDGPFPLCLAHTTQSSLKHLADFTQFLGNCLRPLAEGWRGNGSRFEFRAEWEEQDLIEAKTDQERTTRELVAAQSSLVDFIEMEGEESGMVITDCLL